MRVICIDSDAWPHGLIKEDNGGNIKDGDVYELQDVFMDDGYIWYVVDDGLNQPDMGYWENCFARLTDEQEVEEHKSVKEKILEFFKF